MLVNVKKYFSNLFIGREILYTNSGRSALQAIFDDFNLHGSKVAIQSFICTNFFAPFLIQNNIEPVALDLAKDSLNVSLSEVKRVYEKNKDLKAVLIVHTFGIANPEIGKIADFCRQKEIILIEDCVYCLGLSYKGKLLGTYGDAAIFSFHKSLGFFIGSAYLKNKGRISINPIKYKRNNLDLFRLIKLIPFAPKTISLFRPIKQKTNFKIEPKKTEVLSAPWYTNYFYTSSNKLKIDKRSEVAISLYETINSKVKLNPKLIRQNNFFYSIPIFVKDKDKDKVYEELIKQGISCNKRWIEPLSTSELLLKKHPLRNCPNANVVSKKIINILINPKLSKKQIKNKAEKISKVLVNYI
ncbi:MAG: DegT/DnrJ/EryC1/StrS family aminotransferase [Candidatus Pacearchaeota archaeon]